MNVVGVIDKLHDAEMKAKNEDTNNKHITTLRKIVICDDSYNSIEIAFFGSQLQYISNAQLHDTITIHNGHVNVYNGVKSINLTQHTLVLLNHDNERSKHLQGWYQCNTNSNDNTNVTEDSI